MAIKGPGLGEEWPHDVSLGPTQIHHDPLAEGVCE